MIQPFSTILFTIVGGIFCLLLAQKAKIPSILFLIIYGIVLGPEYGQVIQPSFLESILEPTLSLLVALVLFEGGASLHLSQFKEISRVIRRLLTLGVFITFLIATLAARLFADLPLSQALIFGSIMIVTGPTVIVPILRRVHVKAKIHNILKWEAILVDPLGVVLAVVLFELLLLNKVGWAESLFNFGLRFILGSALGLLGGWIMHMGLSKNWFLRFESQEMGGLFILGGTLLSYGVSELIIHESGLVAATVAGIYLGNSAISSREHVFRFSEQLTMFALSIVFILISSTIPISSIAAHLNEGLIILAIMIFIARPLSVILSTNEEQGMSLQEKIFLSSLAPRGIVSASLATLFALSLQQQDVGSLNVFLPLAFIVILGTIMFYGIFSMVMAKLPDVRESPDHGVLIVGANPFALLVGTQIQKTDVPVTFVDTNAAYCRAAREAKMDAYVGSAVDPEFIQSLDLKGIGRMIALTPNFELNVLACKTFSKIMDRQKVFRLWDRNDGWNQLVSPEFDHSYGWPLVGALGENYWEIWALASQGKNPVAPGRKRARLFASRKDKHKWELRTHVLTQTIRAKPEVFEELGIDFPIFIRHKDNVNFIYPDKTLNEGSEVFYIASKD